MSGNIDCKTKGVNCMHISRGQFRISLGDIRRAPTRWLLALFLVVMNFWSNAPKFSPVGRGVCVYVLKSVRKGRFRNVWVGGGMITFLSKWSYKVDDAQERARLEGPLTILNPNRPHCCPLPQMPLCMLGVFLQIHINACGQELML